MNSTLTTKITPETQKPEKALEIVIHDPKPSINNTTSTSLKTTNSSTSCPICLDEYPAPSIIQIRLCKHFFCSLCLKEYLINRVNTSKVLMIPCPQSGCNQIITKKTIKNSLDPDDYKRYCDLATKKLTLRDARHKFCPKPGCSKQLRISRRKKHTTCSNCRTEICNTCNNFRHEGKSCIEAIDPEYNVYLRESKVRFCIVCKTPGRKESGCNHIKCPACDFDWCWVCGREYSELHVCPYYWSPVSPRRWNESSIGEKFCFVMISILSFPVELLRFLLLWPLYEFCRPETDLSRKKPVRSFLIILGSLFFAIAYSPYVLFYLILIQIIVFVCFVFRPCLKPKNNPTKRWMSGDVAQFSFNRFHLQTQEKPQQPVPDDGRQIDLQAEKAITMEQLKNLNNNDPILRPQEGLNLEVKNEKQVTRKDSSPAFEVFIIVPKPKMAKIEYDSSIPEECNIAIEGEKGNFDVEKTSQITSLKTEVYFG